MKRIQTDKTEMVPGAEPAGEERTKRVYKVCEIREILGISSSSVYNLVERGLFRSVRIGSSIRISKKSFDKWFGEQIGIDFR